MASPVVSVTSAGQERVEFTAHQPVDSRGDRALAEPLPELRPQGRHQLRHVGGPPALSSARTGWMKFWKSTPTSSLIWPVAIPFWTVADSSPIARSGVRPGADADADADPDARVGDVTSGVALRTDVDTDPDGRGERGVTVADSTAAPEFRSTGDDGSWVSAITPAASAATPPPTAIARPRRRRGIRTRLGADGGGAAGGSASRPAPAPGGRHQRAVGGDLPRHHGDMGRAGPVLRVRAQAGRPERGQAGRNRVSGADGGRRTRNAPRDPGQARDEHHAE